MSSMLDFSISILENIPDFLMAEPICYIFGCMISVFVIKVFRTLCNI